MPGIDTNGHDFRTLSSVTLASIGLVACIFADMTHEVLGHVTAAWLADVRVVSLSTVAIQTAVPSRFVAAAGTAANLIVGAAVLLFLTHWVGRRSWACFVWLLAGFNLLNCGYLVASAILNNGDWAVVIGGLRPAWLFRWALGVVGTVLYALSVLWLAVRMRRLVANRAVSLSELRRLVWLGFLASGVLLTVAAIFNPISPHLILLSGIGASFGLNWGLLLIPDIIGPHVQDETTTTAAPMPPSLPWLGLALISGILFIAVFGPGIRI